jgi:hypothetical protein
LKAQESQYEATVTICCTPTGSSTSDPGISNTTKRIVQKDIHHGLTQNIGVTVSDDMNKSNKISGAIVNVNIQGPGFKRTFSGVTDNTGVIAPPFELEISENAIPGPYKVIADAGTMGYNKGSATTTFTVLPKPPLYALSVGITLKLPMKAKGLEKQIERIAISQEMHLATK